MDKSKKKQEDVVSKNHEKKDSSKVKHTKANGWSHIIDKLNSSSGPGDNIYVYG